MMYMYWSFIRTLVGYIAHTDFNLHFSEKMGFLLGDVVSHVTDTISDSQMNNSEVETRMYVYDSVPCTSDRKIFDSHGRILPQEVQGLLQGKHKKVVGWYSFRRGSTMRPSFRERILHENLSQSLTLESPSEFLFLLCASKFTANLSTHTFDHGFMKINNNVFKKVAVTVVNLGDTTHTEYRQLRSHTVSHSRGIYSLIVKQHEQEFLNSKGQIEINRIQALSNTLQRQLQHISESVETTETELAALEMEVKKQRKQVKLKQLEQKQRECSLAENDTSRTNQKAVINEEMEHSGLLDLGLEKSKEPSIDDLLSMEDESIQLTLNNPLPTFDLSDTRLLNDSPKSTSEADIRSEGTSQVSSEFDIDRSKNQKEIKLTAAVSLHDKTEKKENASFSSKSLTSEIVSSKHSKAAKSDKSAEQRTSDPFSFVSSIMEKSQNENKDNTRSRSTMEVQKGEDIKLPIATRHRSHTDSDIQEKTATVTRKKSDRESAAVLAAASAIGNQGERSRSTRSQTKVQGQQGKLPEKKDNKTDASVNGDHDTKRNKSKMSNTSKHCGQEAEEDNSNKSSQDTYDMDVSSSPVY